MESLVRESHLSIEGGAFGLLHRDHRKEKAEAALRESEERFRAIASNTPDHILLQDRDLRYVFVVNPQLGLTEADMLGKMDWEILGKEGGVGIRQTILFGSTGAKLERGE